MHPITNVKRNEEPLMSVAALIVNAIEAVGFFLAGLGALGIVRRQKATAAKVDEIHAKLTEQ